MNSVFRVSGGVKPTCSKSFKVFKYSFLILKNQFTTHYSQFTKKVFAFTLAETLIVMGVIGVVAALTLPNLNQSTNNQEKVAKVKKIYQNLNDALGRATAVYGPIDEWFVNDSTDNAKTNRMGERLTEFMKLSKNCKMTKGCYESGSGTSVYYQFILADGTSVGFNSSSDIYVDIDGLSKGLNKRNRDIFLFRFDSNSGGIEPVREGKMSYYILELTKFPDLSIYGSGWIIDYGNMDYLKLDSNGKCPNGTTPTDENPRCN